MLEGVRVRTVLVPFECPGCGFEERRELPADSVLSAPVGGCPECRETMRFAGLVTEYEAFLDVCRRM